MRIPALPVLLLAALVMTGCVSVREVPAPMSDADLQGYLEDRLDAAWRNTGLEGTVERPESDPSSLVERYREDSPGVGLSECMGEQGIEAYGTTEENGGPVFLGIGRTAEPSEQLAWYRCLAAHPSTFSHVELSPSELEFLYDYYQEWVIPCLELRGYTVVLVPSREEYITGLGFDWIPYNNLGPGLSGADPYQSSVEPGFFIELADECGDPFPGMPYGERYGF